MSRELKFNIFSWYWVAADTNPTTQVFASNVGGMIANTDAGYVAWVGAEGAGAQFISGAANNGTGKVRLTVETTKNMATGQVWVITSVGGTTEANGSNAITVIDPTHVDLLTVNFVHAYTSGGFIGRGTPIPTAAEIRTLIDNFNLDYFNQTSQQYQSLTLTAGAGSTTTLTLPYARTYLITTSAAGQKLKLPSASVPGSMPLGVPITFISSGPNNFTIQDNAGANLVTLGTSGAYQLIKTLATTVAGLWLSEYLSAENQPSATAQIPISQSGAPDNVGTLYLPVSGDAGLASSGVLTLGGGSSSLSTIRTHIGAAPFDAVGYYGLSMNPGHEVSQLNVDGVVAIAPGVGSVNPYLTDQHKVFAQASGGTPFTANAQRVTDAPPGFAYSEKITITSAQAVLGAADCFHMNHFVEGWRAMPRLMLGTANALKFTVLYIVKTSINNHILCASASNAGPEDRCWVNRTVLTSGVWTLISFTVDPETSGTWNNKTTACIATTLNLGAGSNYFGPANQWNTGFIQDVTSDVTNMAATNGATFQWVGPWIYIGDQVPTMAMLSNLVVPFPEEEIRCQRYVWKSFPHDTVPADGVGVNGGELMFSARQAGALQSKSDQYSLPTNMRGPASVITLYNPRAAGTAGQATNKRTGVDCTATASATSGSNKGIFFVCTGDAGAVIGDTFAIHAVLKAQM